MKKIFTLFLMLCFVTGFSQGIVKNDNLNQKSGKEEVVIWEEGFEPAVDTGALPDGWTQKKSANAIGNDLVDLESGDTQWWRYSELYDMGYTSGYNADWVRTGEASMHINWNVEAEQNVYAISPVFTLPEAEEMSLGFWMFFPSSYHTELNILLELDGTWEVLAELNSTDEPNLYESEVLIDLTGKVGEARIAFAYKWTDGIQMNIDDIRVFGLADPVEGFDVTFNVDMTAVEGFDPATHSVWVTGNFTGWAEPGTEGSVELTLVTPKDAHVVFTEDFAGAIPDGWEAVVNEGPAYWAWTDVGGGYGGQLASTTADNGYMMIDSDGLGDGTPENADLISPAIDMTNVSGEIIFSLEHMARTYGFAECRIFVSADDFETETMIYEWQGGAENDFNTADGTGPDPAVVYDSFDISEFAGEANVKIKFNWIGAYDYWWLVDDIEITGTITGGGDEYFYTATVNDVPAGELLYKYFSDVVGAGWDGGEWVGDPNRSVDITEAVVLDDIFGQQPNVNVDEVIVEAGIKVFPNPVRNTLYIQSEKQIDYLRVFDLSGRMVFNADVMDFETSIDVNHLRGGLYIVQLISGQQVDTHKIQVVK